MGRGSGEVESKACFMLVPTGSASTHYLADQRVRVGSACLVPLDQAGIESNGFFLQGCKGKWFPSLLRTNVH